MSYRGHELPSLIEGRLIRRYKRFLADVELEDGQMVTAHCPNSGSMKGCALAGAPVWISESDNKKRKLKFTWELIQTPESMIGVNTQVPNKLVGESIKNGLVEELEEFTKVRPEVKTSDHTRLDLKLENESGQICFVEIKNCTLVEQGRAMFPDAVTTRGQKHLDELARLAGQGHRAVIFYLIQRTDAKIFSPAAGIDPKYAEKLKSARKNGVQIITRDVRINPRRICLNRAVPVEL
ncbi:DNA/RNA nuclease SfsA [Desulfospira joergensenii]|uniref:DNA/RNA nuclease SfsA n=1 Tax=Desulfospira joergensenii TaxID=53329 RepID=UPI0003B2FAAA|nr:DNA/RNA nuclease SfsA [Desulfospira joergensenii]